jgi:hypothetical protein
MARFITEDDPGFISVASELQRWAKEIWLQPYKAEKVGASDLPTSKVDINTAVSDKSVGGITIWGDVVKSNVVNGNQIIYCGLTFKD